MIKITEEMQQRVDKAQEEKKYCVWWPLRTMALPTWAFAAAPSFTTLPQSCQPKKANLSSMAQD